MNDLERYEKYVKEHCNHCKNKDTELCEIRIADYNDIVVTKCVYYDSELQKRKKPVSLWQKW